MKDSPDEWPPLSPSVFHILLALTDGEKHGYAIMGETLEATKGRVRIGPGTLYGTIQRLIDQRLIEESEQRAASTGDDQRRRYYRLTNLGKKVTEAEVRRLEDLVRMARKKVVIMNPQLG